jgi:hypothetical protein
MSFRKLIDGYIDECLEEGVLPDASTIIQEVDVAGQQGGPRDGGNPGRFSAGPPGAGSQASFQDHEAPPTFASASQRHIPAAMFRNQNSAVPPARFGSAARVEAEQEAILGAVFDDLDALDDIEEMSAAELDKALHRKVGGKRTQRILGRKMPGHGSKVDRVLHKKLKGKRPYLESRGDSSRLGFTLEEASNADLLALDEVIARGLGAAARAVPRLVGKGAKGSAKFVAKHPIITSLQAGSAGAGASGYYKSKERKAAARGDTKAMAKYGKRRKVATAVALAPLVGLGGAAGKSAVKHAGKAVAAGRKVKAANRLARLKKFQGASAAGAKKVARAAGDRRLGHAVMATGAAATVGGLGAATPKLMAKGTAKHDKRAKAELKAGRRRRRALKARR